MNKEQRKEMLIKRIIKKDIANVKMAYENMDSELDKETEDSYREISAIAYRNMTIKQLKTALRMNEEGEVKAIIQKNFKEAGVSL